MLSRARSRKFRGLAAGLANRKKGHYGVKPSQVSDNFSSNISLWGNTRRQSNWRQAGC